MHIHSPFTYGAVRHALRLAGLPVVVHIHLDYEAEGLKWAMHRPPNVIVTCAAFIAEQIRAALPEQPRRQASIVVVPNAVDTDRFFPGNKDKARRELGVTDGCPLAVMLANLAPHKGQLTAVRAVAELKQRGIRLACALAGVDRQADGGYASHLNGLIQELDVAQEVRLLGFRTDTPDILRAADYLLLPSTSEGLPLTILEAQATKVLVLAAPTAGIPEVVKDGETGYLIAADDHVGYANRIERLIGDSHTRERLAEKAYLRCRSEHDWTTYWERVRSVYSELLESHSRREDGPA